VFTALVAWFVFRENFDRRIALGKLLIILGGAVLSRHGGSFAAMPFGVLVIAASCLQARMGCASPNPAHADRSR
jgi:drug/metabolite transporter (DMT)-like permease